MRNPTDPTSDNKNQQCDNGSCSVTRSSDSLITLSFMIALAEAEAQDNPTESVLRASQASVRYPNANTTHYLDLGTDDDDQSVQPIN